MTSKFSRKFYKLRGAMFASEGLEWDDILPMTKVTYHDKHICNC